MISVAVVLVTYNRLTLLKEALVAVKAQTHPLLQIIVVNNGSTDGTGQWLDAQPGISVMHQENSGGSGGFFSGIKQAANSTADWFWVMDDDTICQTNTLAVLADKLAMIPAEVGFIGSKCIWTDGNPHLMNVPAIAHSFNGTLPFNYYDQLSLLLIETCSFVSLLINAAAIRKVGLPYKEFFIWGDDQEYTRRITKAGYLGLYCINSIALHKTPVNYFPDFYRDTVPNLWKHESGFRNEFFIVKKNRGFLYFIFWLPIKVSYTVLKLCIIRNNNRPRFIRVITTAAWRSIFFNPKIIYLK
jgi:rhamnopyranosyl-N-acetylglucosaminyl-diphospho-decaprenol beta-1,3/1,4-galactofuranosyltransferase